MHLSDFIITLLNEGAIEVVKVSKFTGYISFY